jgi:hypothetical protein
MFVGHITRGPTDEGYVRAQLTFGFIHKPNPFPDTIVPARLIHGQSDVVRCGLRRECSPGWTVGAHGCSIAC